MGLHPACAHQRGRRAATVSGLHRARVLVAVRNAADPIKGTLYQVTEDGVILDQRGAKFGISYTRVSAIEADTVPETA